MVEDSDHPSKYLTSQYPSKFPPSKFCAIRYAPQAIKIGDVVLIYDDSPRASWKMAVIENLIKRNDRYVQVAEVRTSSVETNQPIYKLYPLEISSEKDEVVNADTINNEDDDQ